MEKYTFSIIQYASWINKKTNRLITGTMPFFFCFVPSLGTKCYFKEVSKKKDMIWNSCEMTHKNELEVFELSFIGSRWQLLRWGCAVHKLNRIRYIHQCTCHLSNNDAYAKAHCKNACESVCSTITGMATIPFWNYPISCANRLSSLQN